MSTLQKEVVDKIEMLSEDNLLFILDMIDRYMKPEKIENNTLLSNRIGIAKDQDLYDDDYDFDEMNDEIAKMFGVG